MNIQDQEESVKFQRIYKYISSHDVELVELGVILMKLLSNSEILGFFQKYHNYSCDLLRNALYRIRIDEAAKGWRFSTEDGEYDIIHGATLILYKRNKK